MLRFLTLWRYIMRIRELADHINSRMQRYQEWADGIRAGRNTAPNTKAEFADFLEDNIVQQLEFVAWELDRIAGCIEEIIK